MDSPTFDDPATSVAQLEATENAEKTTLQKIAARAQAGLEKGASWATIDEAYSALKDIIGMCGGAS